jgi:hypothetical protein
LDIGTGRANHSKRRLSHPEVRFEPASQPEVRNAHGVVGVEMRQKQCIDATDRNLKLGKTDGGTAPGVNKEFLVASLY